MTISKYFWELFKVLTHIIQIFLKFHKLWVLDMVPFPLEVSPGQQVWRRSDVSANTPNYWNCFSHVPSVTWSPWCSPPDHHTLIFCAWEGETWLCFWRDPFQKESPQQCHRDRMTLFYLWCHHPRSWRDRHWFSGTSDTGRHWQELVSAMTTRHIPVRCGRAVDGHHAVKMPVWHTTSPCDLFKICEKNDYTKLQTLDTEAADFQGSWITKGGCPRPSRVSSVMPYNQLWMMRTFWTTSVSKAFCLWCLVGHIPNSSSKQLTSQVVRRSWLWSRLLSDKLPILVVGPSEGAWETSPITVPLHTLDITYFRDTSYCKGLLFCVISTFHSVSVIGALLSNPRPCCSLCPP